jgi:uncharacterized linocin/CFP29 family protein
MADILRRKMAPIADGAWQEIERQGSRVLKGNLHVASGDLVA